MTRTGCAAPRRRGMWARANTFRIVAVLGSAAIALTGCATNSTDSASTPGGSTSVTAGVSTTVPAGAGVTTTVRADGGTVAPEPTSGTESAAPTSGATTVSPVDAPAGGSWDPCSLPESELTAAGLSTSTAARVSGSKFPACKWQSADQTFELIIVASGDSMDTVLAPGTYTDLRRTEYYGRQLALFRAAADTHKLGCLIVTPASFGSIVFTVRNTRVQTDYGDPCGDAQRVGAKLFKSLP
ncbi:DUF3558 family protein [Nocardia sp. SYP-A9097]|uniref:DUF3558 family protein n=1 Tax=Nocardia sp. SYP-A9097 TaxID=2663237 RepID=UPI001891A3E6|nr:DUF3558 family protein [Nocardia sp. SYP-A9097]